jgi:hypothetical protein
MYKIEINDEIQTQMWDETSQNMVDRLAEEVQQERKAALNIKTAEIQTKVDAYKAAQLYQLQHGGPGPSAEFEIMKIVNEFQGQFEVVFKSNE